MGSDREIISCLAFNQLEGLGIIRTSQVVQHYGSAEVAWNAGPVAWSSILGEMDLLPKIENDRKQIFIDAETEWNRCQKQHVQIWTITLDPFPTLLTEIKVPPIVLYVLGHLDPKTIDAISIVGSRRASFYGLRMARLLARDLAERGIVTVSGLARGVDKAVHEESLKVNGSTIAVVGCGLDNCYPPENKSLMDEIAERGLVLSEFPLGMLPMSGNFPRRNRIIAGLSHGTIIVEGTARSGSLITARIAAAEGRDVFAVPGLATSQLSQAPHLLLKQGAILVENGNDVIEASSALGAYQSNNPIVSKENQTFISELAKTILGHLESESLSREELIKRMNIPTEKITALLVDLELNGRVRSLPGGIMMRL